MLPSRFPNLLVNGSSGIAVGMATNIPPHNLREVIDACVCILDNPEAELADLMEHIQGPDFPTRGIIMGRSGIRATYATGRGKVTVRARADFEEFGQNRTRIIVHELPYQVNKRMLISSISDQVRDKRLEGISDLRDETDRNGMRIVIELKKGRQSAGRAESPVRADPAADHVRRDDAGARQQPVAAKDPVSAAHSG